MKYFNTLYCSDEMVSKQAKSVISKNHKFLFRSGFTINLATNIFHTEWKFSNWTDYEDFIMTV